MGGDDQSDIRFVGRPRDVSMKTSEIWGLFADVTMNDLYSLLWRSTTDSPSVKPLSKH